MSRKRTLGPMDFFVERMDGRLEEVTSSVAPSPKRKATLENFIFKVPRKMEQKENEGDGAHALPRNRPFMRELMDTQITGKRSATVRGTLWAKDAKRFRQTACVDGFPRATRHCISDVQFDVLGQLFLVSKMSGQLGVFHFDSFKQDAIELSAGLTGSGQAVSCTAEMWIPCQNALTTAKFHPTNQNCVATIGGNRDIHIYDLEKCMAPEIPDISPVKILKVKGGFQPGLCSLANGFNDVHFFSKHRELIMAADCGGKIFLWDVRCGKYPVIALKTPQKSSASRVKLVTSIALDSAEDLVIGGTDAGQMYLWDIKKAVSNAATPPFSPIPLQQQCLESTGQSKRWAIHSILHHPHDHRMMAFLAMLDNSQWTGLVDLYTAKIVQLHQQLTWNSDAQLELNGYRARQKPCWVMNSPTLAAGNCYSPLLALTDFCREPGLKYGKFDDENHELDFVRSKYRESSTVGIKADQSISCVGCHPNGEDIVAGTLNNDILYFQHSLS